MTSISIVTGANRGLGRAIALAIAANGGDLILTHRGKTDEADAVAAEIVAMGRKAVTLPLVVGDMAGVAGFASALRAALREGWDRDSFDHLVNNAGHGVHAAFAETTEDQFDGLFAAHVKGVFFLTQALLPLIADGGRIVNLSSGLTRFSLPGYAAYAMAKGAVEVMTRYLAKELGPRGIAVNTVAPGAIETDFGGGAVRDNRQLNMQVAAMTAMGRVGVPEDIGPMVAALLAPANRWVTGQRIEVSGGQTL